MSRKTKESDLTRREFMKTVGLAGIALAGTGVTGAIAAPETPAAPPKSKTVPKRPLGKTGVEVSSLCLGGMFDTLNNQLLLKQALKWGVNYWDTAESYGNGMSEQGMGRFFSRNPEARKEVFLVTKLQTKGGNLTERLDKALKRLQTPNVDLFFIHSVTDPEQMTQDLKDWAAQMKQAGKIKFFGFSTHTNMEDCLQGASKMGFIDAVMFTYNFQVMNTHKMKAAIKAASTAGIGLVAMKTQAGKPGPVKVASKAKAHLLDQFLSRGFTDKQARLKVVWETPQIASICSQMPNLTILSSNVAAALDQTKLAKAEIDSLQRYAQETKADYCAGCGKICQDAVGGAIPVNEVMRCLMYRQYYGEPELARLTFEGLGEEVKQRLTEVDYSQAELACPRGLAIAYLMRRAKEMLA
ncbi:MAG: aldo/keto reductase [Deltaproteobacteria bacterium]|nr:aldo/keto reductase [Deltaproteobacteria bacterium]